MPVNASPAIDRLIHERALVQRGLAYIAGVDEAGRGPLAGPVVAAAVCLPREILLEGLPSEWLDLNDSKQIKPDRREALFDWLTHHRTIIHAVASVDSTQIDRVNILQATHQAMRECLARLTGPVEHVLVDGLPVPSLPHPQTAIVKGDSLSVSIAAASIIAKVTRDRLMLGYDRKYPDYGFARHKGYGTLEHREALLRHGPCPIHRFSFAPLRSTQLELFR